MTTWSEIQKLAADLQRVQLAEGVKKLSENNCIEIVSKLISNRLIDIVVGTDGKEYVTRKHLLTEIKNECMANANRIAVTELASRLHVELDHVESSITAIMKQSDSFILCAGEMIHKDYIDDFCEKLNKRLQESGQISMLQLTKSWDLSTEMINNYLLSEIGFKIRAIRMDDQLFTAAFLGISKNKLNAILSSLTKVVSLSVIYAHLNLSQPLFFKIWNELTEEGQVPGRLLGSKNSLKSLYLPTVHVQCVKTFVKKTLLERDFIECGVLKKLSVSDPNTFLKESCSSEVYKNLLFLPSAIVGQTVWKELENSVEDCIKSNFYCTIQKSMPYSLSTGLSEVDNEKIVKCLLKTHPSWKATADNSTVFDPALLSAMLKAVEEFVVEKAKTDAPAIFKALKTTKKGTTTKKVQNDEEDWGPAKGNKKKAGKKGATNTTKAKSIAEEKSESYSTSIAFNDLLVELRKSMSIPEELQEELNEKFEIECKGLYRENVEKAMQTVSASGVEEQRKTHEDNLIRLRKLYTAICVFEESTSAFDEKLAEDLKQFLLKTSCLEFANDVLTTFVDPSHANTFMLSPKARNEAIEAIEEAELRDSIKNLFDSLQTMEKFHKAVFGLRSCSFLIKQPDKSARQEFAASYVCELHSQLLSSNEAPVVLLLAVLALLTHFHKVTLHASGKFVGQLTAHMSLVRKDEENNKPVIPTDILELVLESQRLVVAQLTKKKTQNEEDLSRIEQNVAKLKEFLQELK